MTEAGVGTGPPRTEFLPTVSVVVPARQESGRIGAAVSSALRQDYRGFVEVVVVDGMSTDGTRAEAREAAERLGQGDRLRVVGNPRRIVPAAMNVGIRAARGEVVVRLDAHAVAPPDYVRRCVSALDRTGAECVGGRMVMVGDTRVGRAVALAQGSRFGVGSIAFRRADSPAGPVDTVPYGTFRRTLFDTLGGYSEELACNEDDELTLRIRRRGGTIWFEPDIAVEHLSRSTYRTLFRQYFRYGHFKVRVAQLHRGTGSVRHLVPAAFVTALGLSLVAALVRRQPRWLALVVAPYVVANVAAAHSATREDGDPARVAAAFAVLHLSYGAGFLAGLWRWRGARRRGPSS